MNLKDFTPEMRAILISSLEDKIADYERKISDAKLMISHATGDVNESSSKNNATQLVNITDKKRSRKQKDGGWFDKIKAVLQKTNEPLTSRGVLDKISEEFPEIPNNATSMGSLSPALNASADKGLLIKNHVKGSFATFELADKNIIDFQNAINQ